jgi:hypothetical protein
VLETDTHRNAVFAACFLEQVYVLETDTHRNAQFTAVNNMTFPLVLLLLFDWDFAAWRLSEL